MPKKAGGRPRLPLEERRAISQRLATWLVAHGHRKPRRGPQRRRQGRRKREGLAAALARLTDGAVPARTAEGWFHRDLPKVPETPHLITLARKLPGFSLDWLLLHESRPIELPHDLIDRLQSFAGLSERVLGKQMKRVLTALEALARAADLEALDDSERRGHPESPA